jgi:hypothetical protein
MVVSLYECEAFVVPVEVLQRRVAGGKGIQGAAFCRFYFCPFPLTSGALQIPQGFAVCRYSIVLPLIL